jgi:hypothetical protein
MRSGADFGTSYELKRKLNPSADIVIRTVE